jgi:hypothetical protein
MLPGVLPRHVPWSRERIGRLRGIDSQTLMRVLSVPHDMFAPWRGLTISIIAPVSLYRVE